MAAALSLRKLLQGGKAIRMAGWQAPVMMEEVTDPDELARGQAWRAHADRNAAWLQARAAEIYPRYRGRFVCIAGEELFAADTPREVLALARAAHPEDDGFFLRYIPRDKVARIYAAQR
jgi:hypothetical protein